MSEKPDSLIDLNNEDLFVGLSKMLTGVDTLQRQLADEYYHEYLQQTFGVYLDELIGIYREVTKEPKALDLFLQRINNYTDQKHKENLLHVARQIVRIWYISQFKESSEPSINTEIYAGHWREGILWNVIKAHPPAYSTQEHGYWKYKPE